MTASPHDRLLAWDLELQGVHGRLREALQLVVDGIDDSPDSLARDIRLFCHGFCVALTGHHRGEDTGLFPLLAAEHPELADVIAQLSRDHSMIEHLIGALETALQSGEGREGILRHVEGIGAIMESHLRYEERQLLQPLRDLTASAARRDEMLGPL